MENSSEFRKKFFVLGIASALISFYFVVFAFLLYYGKVVEGLDFDWFLACVVPEAIIFVFVGSLCFIASQDDQFEIANRQIKIPEKSRSTMLIIASFALIVLMAYPCFVLGGAVASGLGTALVTMCALAIIVTSSPGVRWGILASCLSAYIASTWIVSFGYLPDFKVLRPLFHQNLQIALMMLSLFVTLFLSWKGEFLIFPKSGRQAAVQAAEPLVLADTGDVNAAVVEEVNRKEKQKVDAKVDIDATNTTPSSETPPS